MSIYEFRFCLLTRRMRAVLLRVDKETDKMIYGKECHYDDPGFSYGTFALRKDEIDRAFVNSFRIIITRTSGYTYEEAKAKAKRLVGELLTERLDFAFGVDFKEEEQ